MTVVWELLSSEGKKNMGIGVSIPAKASRLVYGASASEVKPIHGKRL
mgnify:CR=1 FL=1